MGERVAFVAGVGIESVCEAASSRGYVVVSCGELGAAELSGAIVGAAEEHGGIDLLVYAMPQEGDEKLMLDLDDVDWDAASCASRAFFLCCKYALPYLISRPGAHIVLLAEREAANAADCAAVAAARAAAYAAAREVEPMGVDVRVCDGRDLPDDV